MTKAVANAPTTRLCAESFNGKEIVSVLYTRGPCDGDWKRRYLDLTPELAGLSLDELRKRFFAGQLDLKPINLVAPPKEDETKEALEQRNKILRLADKIIVQTNQDGERDSWKAKWQEMTGRVWPDGHPDRGAKGKKT